MAKANLVRCISLTTGKVRYVIPALANNATRLRNLGFINAEIEAPIAPEPKQRKQPTAQKKTVKPEPDLPAPAPPADNDLIENLS